MYGDIDCEANAVAFWLHANQLSPEAFIRYNWDFYYDEEEEMLRGCIHITPLVDFLRTHYKIRVTELSFHQLPENEWLIVPGNAYWLSYASDYYMTHRLVHYYPARKEPGGKFRVWDPIFGNMGGEVEEAVVRRAFEDLDRSALWLRNEHRVSSDEDVIPHILMTDYESSYINAINRVLPQIQRLLDRPENLRKDFDFKQNFGHLQSILLGRERYFRSTPSSFSENLTNTWRNVLKQYMRLSYLRHHGWSSFVHSMTQAAAEEIRYLRTFEKPG